MFVHHQVIGDGMIRRYLTGSKEISIGIVNDREVRALIVLLNNYILKAR